jgi:hypothetical protein
MHRIALQSEETINTSSGSNVAAIAMHLAAVAKSNGLHNTVTFLWSAIPANSFNLTDVLSAISA